MRNPVLNLPNLSGAFPAAGKLIASGLVLGLVSTLGTAVSAEPAAAPLVAQAPASSGVPKQILGLWQTKGTSASETIKFLFGPDGKLFIVFPAASGPAPALALRYRINPTAKPMHLDIITTQNETAQTIFELTAARQMRLQLAGTNPGQSRPTAFASNATVFEKVSDATTLPANTRLVQPGNSNTPSPIPQR